MTKEIEARLNKLEARLSSVVDSLNKVNRTTADRVIGLEKEFHKLESNLSSHGKEISKLETKLGSTISALNKVNQTTHDHVVKLERSFVKLEKQTEVIEKQSSPKELERNTLKLVESAIKAYDKKKK
ncbi:MAG: hypothetical protein ACK4GW_10970 [Pseudorhodobacter sp.]